MVDFSIYLPGLEQNCLMSTSQAPSFCSTILILRQPMFKKIHFNPCRSIQPTTENSKCRGDKQKKGHILMTLAKNYIYQICISMTRIKSHGHTKLKDRKVIILERNMLLIINEAITMNLVSHMRNHSLFMRKLKLSSGHRTGKKVSFHSNPKERQCQRMLKLPHNCTHLTCQ